MAFWTVRRRLLAVTVVAMLLALGWAAVVVSVALTADRDEATAADAIAVLGAAQYNGRPSPVFRARLDHAGALYQRGLAPVILVTGGIGPGDTLSESEVGRRYLARLAGNGERGIGQDAVVALPPSGNTAASLRAVADWFSGRQTRRVILVSDGFHMMRLKIIARRLGLVAFPSPAINSPIHANVRLNLGYVLGEGFKVPLTWLLQP